jgi:hypothetical protein
MAELIMLSVVFAECHMKGFYAECHYAECRYAEYHGAKILAFLKLIFALPCLARKKYTGIKLMEYDKHCHITAQNCLRPQKD